MSSSSSGWARMLQSCGVEQKRVPLAHGSHGYLEAGSGEPLIMLHGGSFSAAANWLFAPMSPLAKRFRVLSVDLLGFGSGDRPPLEALSLGNVVDCVREFQDALELPPCRFVGHSLGGQVALRLAYESPQRVTQLAVAAVATIPPLSHRVDPAAFEAPSSEAELRAALVRRIAMPEDRYDYDTLAEASWPNILVPRAVESFRVRLQQYQDPYYRKKYDLWTYARHVTTPTLITWPTDDAECPPEHGVKLQQLISGSTLKTCDGNHFFPMTFPDAFAELLISFFADGKV